MPRSRRDVVRLRGHGSETRPRPPGTSDRWRGALRSSDTIRVRTAIRQGSNRPARSRGSRGVGRPARQKDETTSSCARRSCRQKKPRRHRLIWWGRRLACLAPDPADGWRSWPSSPTAPAGTSRVARRERSNAPCATHRAFILFRPSEGSTCFSWTANQKHNARTSRCQSLTCTAAEAVGVPSIEIATA